MIRYALRAGEHLAISSDAIRRDADGFFIVGEAVPENESRGSVIMVNVRGALLQFKSWGGDSYEAISERVAQAFAADPKPSAVVLRISSPGGAVAGLNECVLRLQRMSKAAKIPLIAYADELAASAAYALCCACSEVLAPPSGIVGSIGVISQMISIAKHDQQEGIEFRIITTGKRKADGHIHMPISDDAVRAETERNEEMGAQFFALAGKARKLPPAKLQSLQAAIYMASKARKLGLIDDVIGLDEALYGLDTSEVSAESPPAPNEGNITDRRATPTAKNATNAKIVAKSLDNFAHPMSPHRNTGVPMPVKLDALIKRTEAAISAETDPKKLRSLQASLAAFAATKAEMDDDDGDDDKGGDDDEGDDESKSKKAAAAAHKAKKMAEAAKHKAKMAEHKQKAAEYEEAAKKCEEEASGGEEEGEEEEARLRSRPASAAVEILSSQADTASQALARVEALEARAAERELKALIGQLQAERRVTPGEVKKWAKKDAAFWAQVAEMRPKALVNTDESVLELPDTRENADLSAAVMKQVELAVSSSGLDKSGQDTLRASLIEEQRKARSNGAGKLV
jgi:signal peptide peptidase SppA